MRVKCRTLFDITRTNVSSRRHQLEINKINNNDIPRKQQINFDTLLQIIGLRKQPEDISDPIIKLSTIDLCGKRHKQSLKIWEFEFTFMYYESNSINSEEKISNILYDCENVPMITNLSESKILSNKFIIAGPEKNIDFILTQHDDLIQKISTNSI